MLHLVCSRVSVPLRTLSKGDYFSFNGHFYRLSAYLRSNRVYVAYPLFYGKFILFSPSELVNHYKGFFVHGTE